MSREFESIRKSVEEFQQNNASQRQIEEKKRIKKEKDRDRRYLQSVEKNKAFLIDSGVKSLFEEIIESGLVKGSNDPVTEIVPIYKKNFLGKKIFDHNEIKTVCSYTPAYICESRHDTLNYQSPVSMSLIFDSWVTTGWDIDFIYGHKEVEIAVIEDELNLVGYDHKHFKSTYIPIKEGQLANTITEAIKNPVSW